MTTFHELWLARQQHGLAWVDLNAALANWVDPADECVIEDLRDPHGKRFLFDDSEGVDQQSSSTLEAMPRPALTPCWGRHWVMAPRPLRPCMPGCTCTCVPCALKRMGVTSVPVPTHVP